MSSPAPSPPQAPPDQEPQDQEPQDQEPQPEPNGDSKALGWTILRAVALLLFFGGLAVAFTQPLSTDLGKSLPMGTERVATVPLFNLWTLAWNVESMGRGFDSYWQAPIFYPASDAFAFSEPQPVLGFLAFVLSGFGLSIVTIYGLLLIGSLALNGLLAMWVLRRVGLDGWPAIVGGVLVLVLPFSHQELGVLQLVPLAGVLAFALAVLRFAESPSMGAGLTLGAGLALAYGLSSQIAVFCALAAAPAALWLWWPHRRQRQAWAGLAAGVALFFALVSPLLVVQMRATSSEDFVRSAKTMRKHSARPTHYLETPWPQLVPTPGIETAKRPSARAFWPGTVRVLLAVLAVGLAWRSRRWRRDGVAGLLLLVTAVLFSFGGHLAIGNLTLPDVLRPIPGLGQIRSFFRFALFAQLAVAALAAGALHGLLEVIRRRLASSPAYQQIGGKALVAAVALLAALEIRPNPGPIEPLPSLDLDLPWLAWIEEQTSTDDTLAFLPFPEGRRSADYLRTSQWMYWQQRHWRPMVNGYSGFFPNSFRRIKKAMETFPSTEALQALHEADVRYCIVPRAVVNASRPPDPDSPIQLDLVFRDEEHELAIFALRPL